MDGRRSYLTALLVGLLVTATSLAIGHGPAAGVEGSWASTGALNQPRIAQTATLLANGKVLVAGGRATSGALTSAELYDPLTETFTVTGAMSTSRWSHTATLLPDGRVLVAGGFTGFVAGNAQAVTDTAEIYDPATGTWSPADSLGTRRALHVASRLDDGTVLVAGGRTCGGPPPAVCDFTVRTNTAERYDAATNTWSAVDPMNAPRHTTSAAKLLDGSVLVPAGFSAPDPHDTDRTADRYTGGTWDLTGNLVRARARQGAMTLHDGTVLVGPGSRETVFGPPFSAVIIDSSELYDPNTDTWQLTVGKPLVPGRFNFQQAVLPNGKALMAGGFGGPQGGEGLQQSAEVYNPASGTWESAGTMTHLHATSSSLANTHDAVVLSANPWRFEFGAACGANCGKVLVLGDNLVDPVADLYTPTPPVPTAKSQCMSGGWKGRSTAANEPFKNQGSCIAYFNRTANRP